MDALQNQLIVRAICEDAMFVGRYLSSLQHRERRPLTSYMSFCIGSYMSLFVYESQRQITRIEPDFAADLSEPAQQILTRSRHSLKLFEDTKLGLEGLQSVFWDEIVPAHRDYFVSQLRFSFLEPCAKDIGVYRYNERIISTTHAASFSLGIEAQALAEGGLGDFLFNISKEYGGYFARFGAQIDASAVSFPNFLDASLFTQKEEDYRAKEFYRRIFNGPNTPGLNATLLLLLGHLNFINEIVDAGSDEISLQYSTFKIRFLGIYQIVRSLRILYDQQGGGLTQDSVRAIESLIQHPVAVHLMSEDIRPLRNTLMHYGIDSRLDHTQINADDILGSLLAATFRGRQVGQFLDQLDVFVSEAAQLMNDWNWAPSSDPIRPATSNPG